MSKYDLMLMSMDQLIGLIDALNSPQLDLVRVAECCEEVANTFLDIADNIAAERASFGKSV
jgi:hypothetical protein